MGELITQRELIYLLERQDPQGLVLIVEGDDDLRFWSLLVPFSQRSRTTVYPARRIEIEGVEGGERGRALRLAEALWGTSVQDKVLFLVDADHDRINGKCYNSNVVFTDFRDLEVYAYNQSALEVLLFSMREDPSLSAQTLAAFDAILRPCGLLRIADFLNDLRLPFQRTLGGKLRKYVAGTKSNPRIEPDRLIGSLLQNNHESLTDVARVRMMYDDAESAFGSLPSPDLVHGKDFVGAVAWRFGLNWAEAERAILSCLGSCAAMVRSLPNLAKVEQFVRL